MSLKEDMLRLKLDDYFIWRHNKNGNFYYSYLVVTGIRPDGKIEFDCHCNAKIADIVSKTTPEAVVEIISSEVYSYAELADWPSDLEWIEQMIQITNGSLKPIFDPRRDTVQDIGESIQRAIFEKKHFLIEVGGDWCEPCLQLEKFIVEHSELDHLRSQHFICIKTYIGKGTRNFAFLNALPKFTAVPHFFVLSETGQYLYSQSTESLEDNESYNYDKLQAFLAMRSNNEGMKDIQ